MLTKRFRRAAVISAVVAGVALSGGVANAGTTTHCTLYPTGQWVCTTTTYTGVAPPGCRVGSPC